jgi:hypothetical protein
MIMTSNEEEKGALLMSTPSIRDNAKGIVEWKMASRCTGIVRISYLPRLDSR